MTIIEREKIVMVFAPLTDADPSADGDEVGVGPLKGDDVVGGGLPAEDDMEAESTEKLAEEEDLEDPESDTPDMGLGDDDFNAQ